MRLSDIKELVRSITKEYFEKATVIFSKESRAVKPQLSLITITTGNVKRTIYSARDFEDEELVDNYLSSFPVQFDLFTHGAPVVDDETGSIIAYENTAVDDMLSFADFLNSEYVNLILDENDIAILTDSGVTDLTGLVNDTNYEYRSQMSATVYFTQKAKGHTSVLSEDGTFKETSSNGGTEKLSEKETGYFSEVDIKEEKENE